MAHYDWWCDCCGWEGGIHKDERDKHYVKAEVLGANPGCTVTLCSSCLDKGSQGTTLRFSWVVGSEGVTCTSWLLQGDCLIGILDSE